MTLDRQLATWLSEHRGFVSGWLIGLIVFYLGWLG